MLLILLTSGVLEGLLSKFRDTDSIEAGLLQDEIYYFTTNIHVNY